MRFDLKSKKHYFLGLHRIGDSEIHRYKYTYLQFYYLDRQIRLMTLHLGYFPILYLEERRQYWYRGLFPFKYAHLGALSQSVCGKPRQPETHFLLIYFFACLRFYSI